jgi:4-aminobutyrate---pyruvate transaminase
MVTCAKGLSAAMLPISAILINERVFNVMKDESKRNGVFVHGFTYAGHPVASAVAREVIKIYEELDIVTRVKSLESTFLSELRALTDHPLVGDASGVGLIAGIEIVKDKETRESYDAEIGVDQRIDRNARKRGLILRPVGNRVCYSPPLIISNDEILEIGRITRLALGDTLSEIRAL